MKEQLVSVGFANIYPDIWGNIFRTKDAATKEADCTALEKGVELFRKVTVPERPRVVLTDYNDVHVSWTNRDGFTVVGLSNIHSFKSVSLVARNFSTTDIELKKLLDLQNVTLEWDTTWGNK